MAGSAIDAVFAIVFIIILMTGIAVHGCTQELFVLMTRFTGDFRMLALQLERREIVIEFRRRPAIRRVTINARNAKAAFMRIIGMMAGVAVLQCHCEVAKAARVDMTLYTGKPHMLAGDFE